MTNHRAILWLSVAVMLYAFIRVMRARWNGQQHRILEVLRRDTDVSYLALDVADLAKVPRNLVYIHLAAMVSVEIVNVRPDPRTSDDVLRVRGGRPRFIYNLRPSCASMSIETMEAILRNRE